MLSVRDALEYCVAQDYQLLAHACFWAVSSGKVGLEDSFEQLKEVKFDCDGVSLLLAQNVLGMGRVRLYLLELAGGIVAYYFAESSLEAVGLHRRLFRDRVLRSVEAGRSVLVTHFLWADTGEELTLAEYKERFVDSPAYCGHARVGEQVMYRLDQNK